MSSTEIKANGWTAVSVSAKAIIDSAGRLEKVPSYTVQDIEFPSGDALVGEVQAFVKARLSPEAYNHSMRVFYWGKYPPSQPTRSKKTITHPLTQEASSQSACCPSTPRRCRRRPGH